MRRLAAGTVVAVALTCLAGASGLLAQEATNVHVVGLPPGTSIEIALNGGKVAHQTADTQGALEAVLDVANLGKVQVQAYIVVCEDGRNVLHLVTIGGEPPPEDEKCTRRPLGVFWLNDGETVVIDARAAFAKGRGLGKSRKIGIGAAAAAGGAILAKTAGGGGPTSPVVPTPTQPPQQPPTGGGTTPTPTPTPTPSLCGPYGVLVAVMSDPDASATFINLFSGGDLSVSFGSCDASLAAADSGLLTISGPVGSNWVTVSGTYDQSTGQFNLTGQGLVAGRPNVSVTFQGTLTQSGALNGAYAMGAGGELPGGQPTVYSVQGQKR